MPKVTPTINIMKSILTFVYSINYVKKQECTKVCNQTAAVNPYESPQPDPDKPKQDPGDLVESALEVISCLTAVVVAVHVFGPPAVLCWCIASLIGESKLQGVAAFLTWLSVSLAICWWVFLWVWLT